MATASRFQPLAQASVTRSNASRRQASINTTYAMMRRQLESLDELREGAMAGSACGNQDKALQRLEAGAPTMQQLYDAWFGQIHRVRVEKAVSAWR